jgi:shikimate dehydrogenase
MGGGRGTTTSMAAPVVLCGSLSLHPVGLGRSMHEAGYRAAGLPWVYVPFAVERDLEGALRGMRALGIRGLGISMPHKLAVMPLLDRLDPMAARIGAVNTVVNEGGTLVGHNTDAAGAVAALREARDPRGARVVVLGAGGAARAVVFALVGAGAEVRVANRSRARAMELVEAAGARDELTWDEAAAAVAEADVVVNATSVGMVAPGEPPGSPLPADALRAGLVVMDIVYKPVETELIAAARAAGATTVHGGRMLLHQAAAQWALYTGQPAPLEAMDAALRTAIG